jgi:hypothetical protein
LPVFLLGGRHRSYDETEAFLDLLDANVVARDERRLVGGVRLPELAVQRDEPGPAHDSLDTHELARPHEHGIPTSAHDAAESEAE